SLRIFAIGHLQSTDTLAIGDAHCFDITTPKLHVQRLTADSVSRARHDIGRGHSARDGHADARIVVVNGIQGSQARLHRTAHFVAVAVGRHVGPRIDTYVRMAVDEAGNYNRVGQIPRLGSVGDGDFVRGANGDYLGTFDQQNAMVDGLARDGIDAPHF